MTVRKRMGFWSAYALGVASFLTAFAIWQSVMLPRPAAAQVPDSGKQRNEMIKELQTSNKQLAEIAGILREIRDAQPKSEKTPPPRGPGLQPGR